MEQLTAYGPSFLLIFTRISSFFVTAPLFAYRTIPVMQRLIIALMMAMVLAPTIPLDEPLAIDATYIMLILREVTVGLSLGIVAFMILSVVQIAGGFIDFQMGFAIANVIDPQTGAQSPLIGQFFNALALLLLLSLDGHHLMLDGLFYSYSFIPIDQLNLAFGSAAFGEWIVKLFALLFATAFQMAIPIVATLFLVDLALGITARTVPQLNIFVVGFPIKITVSFLVLIAMIPVTILLMRKLFELMAVSMRDLMLILGGG